MSALATPSGPDRGMSGPSAPLPSAPALRQHTLSGPVTVEGVGLHTGAESRVVLHPARTGAGLRFVRVDLPGEPSLTAADIDHNPAPGRTALTRGDASVETIEHLLAVLVGLGVDNVRAEFHSSEPPVGDGSSREFAEAIARVGLVPQDAPREVYVIEEPIVVEGEKDGARLVALPRRPESQGGPLTQIGYSLAYQGSDLARGWAEFALTSDEFVRAVAPARTFCMARDVEKLLKLGMGKGATYENTLVIDGDGVLNNELRFPDEPVRHKVLDLLGDLGLLGAPVVGRVSGFRSGHSVNSRLVREILRTCPRRRLDELFCDDLAGSGGPVMGTVEIGRILPHRYPFLLVDSVIELDPERRILAVKNVSWNEEFFLGHFPGSPVMPGVLQVEALAQAAGLLLSKYVRVGEKMAALVGLDRVKIRRPVLPGDRLLLTVKVKKIRRTLAICEGKATVAGETAAEATLLFGLIRDRSSPSGSESSGGGPSGDQA